MEYSAGAVIRKGDLFLVVRSTEGFWGFPKGHMEEGEEIKDTVKREVMEEVGLQIDILDRNAHIEYPLKNGNVKKNTLFLAEHKKGKVKLNSELTGFKWLPKEKVLEILSFDDLKELFKKIV